MDVRIQSEKEEIGRWKCMGEAYTVENCAKLRERLQLTTVSCIERKACKEMKLK